ncbi:MAG TPA: histidine kinase, partial [Bryobacteraceae bacterium]|nr:histidine kinase [Bryobacteraceae bacterium]
MLPNPTSRRAVMGILIFGFALVVLLLLAAGAVAIRNTRLIRSTAADLAREQSLTARLIDDIQREQAFVDNLLQHLRGTRRSSLKHLRAELAGLESRFDLLVHDASQTGARAEWLKSAVAAGSFFSEARRVLHSPEPESVELERLWSSHEELLSLVVDLVQSSSARVASVEKDLETQSRSTNRQSLTLLTSSLLAALACAVLTIWLVGRAFTRLAQQERELARVSFHLLQAQEVSAQRFSHELHDEMGQVLSAFKANLVTMNPSNLDVRRRDCLQLTDQALASVRELSQLLRPVILDDFGLDAALLWLTDRFSMRTGIQVNYNSRGASRLPDETETHLFRIAQEALTNIARHSKATRVGISFAQSARRA